MVAIVKTILLNSNNVSNSLKNQYTYKFRGGALDLKAEQNHSIAVASICIPYSFFNISDVYGNRNFQLIIPTGPGTTTTYDINLPSSFMDVTDLNKYLQWWFIKEGKYCVSASGEFVYFFELEYNVSTYSVNSIFYNLNLPSEGSNPFGMYLDPTRTMQLVVSSSNVNFGRFLGLDQGTYPSSNLSNITVTVNSNITVEGSPINSLALTCNLVDNSISTSPETFYTFSPSSASFGSNLVQSSPELIWISCYSGRYNQIVFELKDQLGRNIECRDANIAIQICIKSE